MSWGATICPDAVAAALAIMHCPSRRAADIYPNSFRHQPFNYPARHAMAKSDYAINAGNDEPLGGGGGPESIAEGLSGQWDWKSANHNGIGYQISEVRPRDITDGTSKTILIGEKYLQVTNYSNGCSLGDNQCLYTGTDSDTIRSTHPDADFMWDRFDRSGRDSFGSPHAAGCNFVFCDGSVRTVSFNIDIDVYVLLGSRNDGTPIDAKELQP